MILRGWILLLGAVCAAAGFAGGVLHERSAAPAERWPLADYEQRLVQEFDLSAARARALRTVLLDWNAEVERVKRAHMPSWTAAMGPELTALGETYGAHIRNLVIPPSQRERYAALAAGVSLNPNLDL